MSSPSQPSALSCWLNSNRASRVPTTGSIVAATAAGAASIRWTAAKNRKFPASTDPAVRPARPRQAAAAGGGAGVRPDPVSTKTMTRVPPRARDRELLRDLEQRDENPPAHAYEQPAACVHPEQLAAEAEPPEREAHRAHEHAPEPDARRRHESVQAGGEWAGSAPRRARREREEVAGETWSARDGGRGGVRGRHTSSPRNTVTACPPSPTRSPARRTRSTPPRRDA